MAVWIGRTWTREQVIEELQIIIVETRGVLEEEVVETATLFEDLTLESIDFLEISFRIEESFGFVFPTDDLGEIFNRVGDGGTTADAEAALVMFEGAFFTTVDRNSLTGLDPFDVGKLRSSVFKLFTFKLLVDFVEKMLSK